MKCLKKTIALFSILFAGVAGSHASDQFSGEISFSSRPPMAALVYIPGKSHEMLTPEIDQIDKQFTKNMVVASPQSQIVFKNSDAVDHNIFANDPTHHAKFDVGLMESGGEKIVPINWKADSIVRIGCKIHPRMRAYIATVEASYQKIVEFDKQQSEYRFDLPDVPGSAEKIIIRMPKYEPLEFDIRSGAAWSSPIVKNGRQRGEITITRRVR